MSNGQHLELMTLPERHPLLGTAVLHQFGPSTIYRLSVNPTQQPAGTICREVEVNWVARPGNATQVQVSRIIGWNNMPENWAKVMEQLPLTINDRNLTEQAAIGVLALLINDLEKAVLQTVLQIGSGGDYLVRLAEPSNPIQVEVSGVRDDPTREKSSERLRVKSNQVLANSRVGYVSVTAFSYSNTATVHSFLRYVKKRRKKGGKK